MNHLSASTSMTRSRRRINPPHIATLVMLGAIGIAGLVVGGWFAGQGTIRTIFANLNQMQQNPPLWLEAPMAVGQYLLFWTVALMVIVLIVTKISPRPQLWSRTLVVGILLILAIRYLTWRSLSTLNLSTPLNGVFSIVTLVMEFLLLGGSIIQLALLLRVRDRRAEADRFSTSVLNGSFTPSVDIFIPTYNEAPFILRRTIMGCQAIDYEQKIVYLLDDTRRPEVEKLAKELGCEYRTRPDNSNAKAGNLNHALTHTRGELIVVFDADFIPTQNFLTRTVGFFQDPQVGLVQTPQTFYNPDPIARNLGLEDALTPEEEVFYRQIQPIRDGVGSVICAGTSFVVRRSALNATGGFVTESLSEDYFTGIRLAASGYRVLYLNEKLSAGLAAENIASQVLQRVRWAQGTLQAFFIKTNPLTIKGLNPIQRLAHLEGILHWFSSFAQIWFLCLPIAYAFLGVLPVRATSIEAFYFFLPFYLVQLTTFAWLNERARSAVLSNIYTIVLSVPLAITVFKVFLNPFGKGFKVTPKGSTSDRYSFNWGLAVPLIVLFGLSAFSLWVNAGTYMMVAPWRADMPLDWVVRWKGVGLGWIWSTYNLLTVGIALLILMDAPRPSPYEWYGLRRTVRLQVSDRIFWGTTTALSEIGVEVALTQADFQDLPDRSAQVELLEDSLALPGKIVAMAAGEDCLKVRVAFDTLTLDRQRRLVEVLYCRPGQWKSRLSPDELTSLGLLFRTLLKPRFLFERKAVLKPIAVSNYVGARVQDKSQMHL
ncbi:glycosyltransferase [Altericista sp. CCNU0014]|uniref:glycosyltransferase n=1 Tax=Altericista sp. CCNU0014 TaxID=3082949 RepID=UPI00384B3418